MLSLASPLWLLGLAAVPLIRWLHRFRARGLVIPVSALWLWREASLAEGGGRRLARPDPSWRLRAAVLACLALALAGPCWGIRQQPLQIWVDDSLSMYALENGVRRITTGVDALIAALEERRQPRVTVRSLANPARRLSLEPDQAVGWRSSLLDWLRLPGGEPRPPAAVQMESSVEHWLISDGADPALVEWLPTAPVARVIHVGRTTENVALTDIAARPSLLEPGTLKALVTVMNLGQESTERELEIYFNNNLIKTERLTLAANGTARRTFTLPDGESETLHVRLSPSDALPLDDEGYLDIPSAAAIRLAGECGPALRAALAAHPALRLVEDTLSSPAVTVSCGAVPAAVSGPFLLLHPSRPSQPVQQTPRWHAAAGSLQSLFLDHVGLASIPGPVHPAAHEPLLTAGETPLIMAGANPVRMIDVLLDMEAPALIQQPYYPVLVSGLVAFLLERPLLEDYPRMQRQPAASRIAPTYLTGAALAPGAITAEGSLDLSPWLLGLGGLLLVLDSWRVCRSSTGRAA